MSTEGDTSPLTYVASGLNYETLDPAKRLAQVIAAATGPNLERFGMQEVTASRGESAYVWDEGESYRALVVEGLGTKSLVADAVRPLTGRSHYDTIAQDTVAMIINDLITSGADPQVINAYFAIGDSEWFLDKERTEDLLRGWGKAVIDSGASWGGGETATLKGVITPGTIDLAGSAVGIIKPKDRLITGDKLKAGDGIFLVESSGIHANGLTLARAIADKHPEGYGARLSDGRMYGEALLDPTHIYAGLVRDLFEAGVDVHYMTNITGHGWRKLMRANRDFSYVIDRIPDAHPVFDFIQDQSGNDDGEMYGNLNMGAGFAVMMPLEFIPIAQQIAFENHKLRAGMAGVVEDGPKQVMILPKGLIFEAETLAVR